MSATFGLVCWSCGAERGVEASRQPGFAFEVAQAAEAVGWIGSFDMNRHRVLVFCSPVCRSAAITKSGAFRMRPPRRVSGSGGGESKT